MQFKFPDVGEGIHEGVIVNWLKKEGDDVKEDEPIVEVETDKAVVEIPSLATGKLTKINYKVGDTVHVGEILCEFDTGEAAPAPQKTTEDTGNVVGSLEDADSSTTPSDPLDFSSYKPTPSPKEAPTTPKILPKIRKLAESLGVNIDNVKPTGNNNTITEDDIKNASSAKSQSTSSPAQDNAAQYKLNTPEYGEETIEDLPPIRKAIARNMINTFVHTAQVTHFDELEVNKLVQKRESEKDAAAKEGIKLTFLSYIAEALIKTLAEFPKFNAYYDHENQKLILKKYVNLGIAVDTEAGLIVPVIKNAEKQTVKEIAQKIVDIADRAKSRKLSLEELKDSTVTITNFGSLGVKFATPVLNYPNLIMVGVGMFDDKLYLDETGQIKSKKVMPFSLTYDHQIIDGADAARFTSRFAEILNEQ